MLFGSAFFAISGIGPILAWIVGALEGAGLVGMGTPKDSVIEYELALIGQGLLHLLFAAVANIASQAAIVIRYLSNRAAHP